MPSPHMAVTRRAAAVSLFCACLLATPMAHAAPTPISSQLQVEVSAQFGSQNVVGREAHSQTTTLDGMAGTAVANALIGNLGARAWASATATFDSAAAGHLAFDNFGWDITGNGSARLAPALGPIWTYTFVADVSGLLEVDWAVTGSGSTFGLQGFFMSGFAGGNQPFALGTSGTVSKAVVAGQRYEMAVSSYANVHGNAGLGRMSGTIDWRLPGAMALAVPEPGSLALGVLALGALTVTTRRRPWHAA